MTREEAISVFQGLDELDGISMWFQPNGKTEKISIHSLKEACRIAINAIRAQQEPVKLDRSRWEGCKVCRVLELDQAKRAMVMRYCAVCGRPLTDEAWAELERRINGGTNDVH